MASLGKKNTQYAVVLIFLAAMTVAASRLQQAPVNVDWRPNKPANGVRFVGSQACAECHRSKVAGQSKTPMGMALALPETCDILRSNARLAYRSGKYNYQITREGNRSLYAVSDGTDTISVPIPYCFGKGEGGQTYVLEYKGKFYESRVSFYADIKGLDITMGHAPTPPATLEAAMGREMEMSETRSCFGCHTTNSINGSILQLDQFMQGVTCEACHGPGEKHVEAMKAGDSGAKNIFNPKKLSTEDMSDFCGACHRTWEQVATMNIRGVFNVRFQPYRLTNSKCYDPEDKRIRCTACHDPHEGRKQNAAFYDSKCIACHSGAAKAAKAGFNQVHQDTAVACPVSKTNCVKCHMPKYEIPGSHLHFSDHHIRIVRPGEPYPN